MMITYCYTVAYQKVINNSPVYENSIKRHAA